MSFTWEDWVLIFLAIYAVGDVIASIYTAYFAEKVVADSIIEEEIQKEEETQKEKKGK